MIFDPASAPHLKPWLVRTLEPICDAEPGALADYILALLKHNVPESDMKKELFSQLEEFLESECGPFVDTLFTALRTKSYLPYAPPSPPPQQAADEGIPIPLDAIMEGAAGPSSERTRKRSSSSDGRDGRPKKGPRLGNDAGFPGYGHAQGAWGGPQQQFGEFPVGGMDVYGMSMGPMGMGMPMNGMPPMGGRRPQGYQPPGQKRGICRDYHNHGFCARGEMCKFSHGEGAVVPSQLFPMNPGMMDFNMLYNMMNQNNTNVPYDPSDPQAVRQNQRAPIIPRVQQEDGSRVMQPHTSGELPVIQDLTPTDGSRKQMQQPPQPPSGQPNPALLAAMAANGFDPSMFQSMPGLNGAAQYPGMPMAVDVPQPPIQPPSGDQAPVRPPSGFRGRGRGRGGFGAEAAASRPGRRGDKTLVVEKIPHDKLSHEGIVEWFKKFGDVTNVAVDRSGQKALVSFASHEEAHAAWKSEDAVFGNRFVKVFWHRPMEGHGQIGQRALAASQGIVANLKSDGQATPSSSTPPPPIAASSSTNGTRKAAVQSSAASALAAKQELLEKQIAEQKTLMAAFSSATATAEEKKQIMERLRALGKEMEETRASVAAIPVPMPKKATSTTDPEEKERERLDKELENRGDGDGQGRETTEELKAKLERLKAEAASLGIADGAEPQYGAGFRGAYRGRARGGRGAFYRGGPVLRGGPPRGSMKLDNRPKKLMVKGVPSGEEGVQVVKEWYEPTGQVESVESADDGVVVSFKSRSAAEQALAKGSVLPTVGKVPITWYTPNAKTGASSATSLSTPVAASPAPQPTKDLESLAEPTPVPHHQEDEEMVASGWGDEDGDGMGMQ